MDIGHLQGCLACLNTWWLDCIFVPMIEISMKHVCNEMQIINFCNLCVFLHIFVALFRKDYSSLFRMHLIFVIFVQKMLSIIAEKLLFE